MIDDDTIRLTSGRLLYANRLILGIGPDGQAFEGCDGSLPGRGPELTIEERQEIAAIAIERWKRWAVPTAAPSPSRSPA